VTAWEKTAEFVANYLTKGRLVAVDGRLQSRKFTAQDGSNREVVEIVAENVQGLDRPREDGEGGGQRATAAVAAVPDEDEYDPFAND
jgi:single-strand DNA-binding protein